LNFAFPQQISTTQLFSDTSTASAVFIMVSAATAPFLVHALIETPAALTFILKPSTQLQPLPPAAALIVQSFGGSILATNLIALVLIRRPFDDVARHVALAFAFWHIWPCYRAYMRINGYTKEEESSTTKTLGGPVVHLGVHIVLLTMFLCTWLFGNA
jgi:hypothetical protein